MGSCLSMQDDESQQDKREYARPNTVINTTVVVSDLAWRSRSSNNARESVPLEPYKAPAHLYAEKVVKTPQAYYGEYKCQNCGRHWSSTLSWCNSYQNCAKCQNKVYPKNQREVRQSDIKRDGKPQEHLRELCQKCKQLGYNCGDYVSKQRQTYTQKQRPRSKSTEFRRREQNFKRKCTKYSKY